MSNIALIPWPIHSGACFQTPEPALKPRMFFTICGPKPENFSPRLSCVFAMGRDKSAQTWQKLVRLGKFCHKPLFVDFAFFQDFPHEEQFSKRFHPASLDCGFFGANR
jgi:hypothetical protein